MFLFLLCPGFKGLIVSKKSSSKLLLTADVEVVCIEFLFAAEDATGQSSHFGFYWNFGDALNGYGPVIFRRGF